LHTYLFNRKIILKIHYSLEALPKLKNPVVTIGVFDGVHLGHLSVIKQLTTHAKKIDGNSVLVTFDPHPQEVLNPNSNFFLINTIEERIELLKKTAIDYVIILPFTFDFSQIPYDKFLKEYIVEKIGAKAIVMGPNHNFGREKEGNHEKIAELCKLYNVDVIEIPEFIAQDIAIRSSKIRKFIAEGDYKKAEELLGHPIHNY
jgi:riboflavin kinase/FMN adenylyltransferase